MKFSNSDIIRLTEIKQYLLDPSYTFRLYDEATTHLTEALSILKKYSFVEESFYNRYESLRLEMNETKKELNKLRAVLIQIGKIIGELTNR